MTAVQGDETSRLKDIRFELDRRDAVPRILGDAGEFLIVSGLAGASKDVAAATDDSDKVFTMAGAMGAAVSIGVGLALARPAKQVLVVTGDGELLMNLGTLATAAVMDPKNLSILCVDNGHYGETGYQRTHTSFGTDLEAVARATGISHTQTVDQQEEIPSGRDLLRNRDGLSFVLLRVKATEPPRYKRNLRADECRVRFRKALAL